MTRFRKTAIFVIVLGSWTTAVSVQLARAQEYAPSIVGSVGILDPALSPASNVLHPEVEGAIPLSVFGWSGLTSLAVSLGYWDAGAATDGCPDCSTFAYHAVTFGARIRRIVGGSRLLVRLQAGIGTHFMSAEYLDGIVPADAVDADFRATVTSGELGASLVVPLGNRILVEGGPRLGLRLSQGTWGPNRPKMDWRLGIGYFFGS